MMSANAVGKAPTGTVTSTFTGAAQGGASIPLRQTQPTSRHEISLSNGEGKPPRGTGTSIQLLSTSRIIRIATQERLWCVLVPNPPTTPATAEKGILSDGRPAGCVTQGETPLPSRPLRNSLCMGCDKGRAAGANQISTDVIETRMAKSAASAATPLSARCAKSTAGFCCRLSRNRHA